jgi:hypothetical protein
LEFGLQPPLLGNCQFDKMLVTANGRYPLLCGQNTGQHIYLDVAGKSHTDISFLVDYLKAELYSCPDRFNLFSPEVKATTKTSLVAHALAAAHKEVIFSTLKNVFRLLQ